MDITDKWSKKQCKCKSCNGQVAFPSMAKAQFFAGPSLALLGRPFRLEVLKSFYFAAPGRTVLAGHLWRKEEACEDGHFGNQGGAPLLSMTRRQLSQVITFLAGGGSS
jgi:hypothetical protein